MTGSETTPPVDTLFGDLFDPTPSTPSSSPSPSSPPSRPRACWDDLCPELKLRVAWMFEWFQDEADLGNADPKLIPYLVNDPALKWRQRAMKTAMGWKKGEELLEAMRKHLPAFHARDPIQPHFLKSDETIDVIRQLYDLRAGRGPPFAIKFQHEECEARCKELPQDIHVDVEVWETLTKRRQPMWTLPTPVMRFEVNKPWNYEFDRLVVRGRHAFASDHLLNKISLDDLDLTRGRLDLSKIVNCDDLYMDRCVIGTGDFGIRWPAKVRRLHLEECTIIDQTDSFQLPDELEAIDFRRTFIATETSTDWQLPNSLTYIVMFRSGITSRGLPRTLPPKLKEISYSPEHVSRSVRKQVFPKSVQYIHVWPQASYKRDRKEPKWPRKAERNLRRKHRLAEVYVLG